MAGNIGSPLCAELNRIANNGVYPDRDDFLEEQGAANVWAGTTGLGLLGALNYIVDPTRTDDKFKGLTAVCNELAGTTGLSDVDALRTIGHAAEVLLRGTTPQSAAFYIDAAAPTNWGSLGYVRLNGVIGNYLSVPDSAALDITGDIDIRWYGSLDSWTTSGASQTLISKRDSTGNQRSWALKVSNAATVFMHISLDGTAVVFPTSTVSLSTANGTPVWIRATRVASTGLVKFFTSPNGSTWTQLGADVSSTAGNIFASTARVEIGARDNGLQEYATGNFYRSQILNGIDGTTVLDVNIASNYTSSSLNTFTATTGQTVTVNGVDTVANLGNAGSLLPTTIGSSTAADSNDAKFLDHTGTNYLYNPGRGASPFNSALITNAANLSITGDITLVANIAPDSWATGGAQRIITKGSYPTENYSLALSTLGALQYFWNNNGTWTSKQSTAVVPFSAGQAGWVKVVFDVDNGAGGYDFKFYTSTNGTTWTQLGTTLTTAGIAVPIANSNNVSIMGDSFASEPMIGKIYRAQIFSDITETNKVLDVDTSLITTGATTEFTAVTGQTVTMNRSTSGRKTVAVTQPTWLFGTDDYMEVNNRYMAHSTSDENYVYLSGASGNYMSVADAPPLDITGDLDLQVKVALDDWTPSSNTSLVSKWITGTSQRSFNFRVDTSGILRLQTSVNGVADSLSAASTVAPTVADGAALWVRVTLDVDNGAGGNDARFFTSNDGTTWTQLGSTVTTAGTTSIFSGSSGVEIGARNLGLDFAKGKFYRAIIKNGIDGTTVLDANAAVITLPSQTTFTDSSSNAYTVTINKSGVGTFVSTGNYLYLPGVASNNATAPDSAALDITGDIDLRCKVALDDWTPSAIQYLISKYQSASQRSYGLSVETNGRISLVWSTDGTGGTLLSATSTVAPTVADGATLWVRGVLDVDNGAAGKNVFFYTSTDGLTWTQLGTTVTTAGTTSIFSSTSVLEIGSVLATSNPLRGKVFRAQVLNGIGGTVAFDANFEGSITSLNQASFTESSSNAATVTINRSGSAYRSAGITQAGYLYPGATNTFANSTLDHLNFGATDSFTFMVVYRQWNTQGSFTPIFGKQLNRTLPGYGFEDWSVPGGMSFNITDNNNVNVANAKTGTYTIGSVTLLTGVRNVNADNTLYYNNATPAGTPVTDTTTTSLANNRTLILGYNSNAGAGKDIEFIGAAVFRSALTPKNIADITNYFQGRD